MNNGSANAAMHVANSILAGNTAGFVDNDVRIFAGTITFGGVNLFSHAGAGDSGDRVETELLRGDLDFDGDLDLAVGDFDGGIRTFRDFAVEEDKIRLENAVFTGLATGALASSAFAPNLSGLATDASQRIVYETDTGRLFFDADGSGAAAGIHFGTLSANLALDSGDLIMA